MREKIPYKNEMYLENVNLTEEGDPENIEQPFNLEDFLYETWKENQEDTSCTVQTNRK